jgi:predicted phage terminase large subunit-like protein
VLGPCHKLERTQAREVFFQVLADDDTEAMRRLCREDLFFLLAVGCKRSDLDRDWLYARCREVESAPDGHLDLWAREHYKSTIITFGLTIQDILRDSNITVGIFSHTRPIAKAFLTQIKREFETNTFLQMLFPDVLYANPAKDSPQWSLDGGIVVKRGANPKEATVEAWGLVDGQPTSKHYRLLVYDDVVTRESVTTPEQIEKTTEALGLSYNLGADGGARRFIGTRYHFNDTYKTVIDRRTATPRLHPATQDGTMEGAPVLLSRDKLEEKRRDMGPYVYGCQMLQNPIADKAMGFREEWLRHYTSLKNHERWNYYITVDPAHSKKKDSDFTVMWVWGLGFDRNYYLCDMVRDRLNLTERTDHLFRLVKQWRPVRVGYERYGLQADIEHIRHVQDQLNYRFEIVECAGAMPKPDRIRRLVPLFEQHRVFLPNRLMFADHEGMAHDLVREFIQDEYLAFPVSIHDDALDCASRILDDELQAQFPREQRGVLPAVMRRDHHQAKTEFDVLSMGR